jgi:hypothetical protein
MPLLQPANKPEFLTLDQYLALQDCGKKDIYTYGQYMNLQWCRYLELKFRLIPVNNMELNAEQNQAVRNLINHGLKFCKALPAVIKHKDLSQAEMTSFLTDLNDALNQRIDPADPQSEVNFKNTIATLSTKANKLSEDLTPSLSRFFLESVKMVLGVVLVAAALISIPLIPLGLSLPALFACASLSCLSMIAGGALAQRGFFNAVPFAKHPAKGISEELTKDATQDALVKLAGPLRI